MALCINTRTVMAAGQPRKLQQGTFHETSRGLVMLKDSQVAKTPPFSPQMNDDATKMQKKVLRAGSPVSFTLPSCFDLPVFVPGRAHGFAVPDSSTATTIKPSFSDNKTLGRSRRDVSELIKFEASIRRLEQGSSLESGEILESHHASQSLKRERELSPPRSFKRVRHSSSQHNIPYPSIDDKIFYGGADLKRIDPESQEEYTLNKTLGYGGQGTAYLLNTCGTGSLVVCKVMPHTRTYKKEESELHFLRNALPRHSRIIGLRSAIVRPHQTQLYLDYCSGGDLSSFIDASDDFAQPTEPWQFPNDLPSCIPESFIWHIFLQLTEALAFIHHGYDRNATSSDKVLPDKWLSVIHRDIKPCNIFLQRAPSHPDHPGPEPYPKVVLADFGLAKQARKFDEPPTSDNWMGTYIFQPPELPHHSTKGDVWSAGANIFLMMAGYIPTENLPEHIEEPHVVKDLWFQCLVSEQSNASPGYGMKGYSKGLEWCMQRALTENPRRRSSSLQLLHEIENCRDRMSARWEELVPWL
ncbi:MAG: hypothetical protein Q9198_001748 [Flavoplaca austrocitrina]